MSYDVENDSIGIFGAPDIVRVTHRRLKMSKQRPKMLHSVAAVSTAVWWKSSLPRRASPVRRFWCWASMIPLLKYSLPPCSSMGFGIAPESPSLLVQVGRSIWRHQTLSDFQWPAFAGGSIAGTSRKCPLCAAVGRLAVVGEMASRDPATRNLHVSWSGKHGSLPSKAIGFVLGCGSPCFG